MSQVFYQKDIQLEDLGEGVSRKVLAYDQTMMMVEVRFEKDAVGAMHSHPHEQTTYVVEGEFEFTIAGDKHTVKQGDTIYFTPNDEHGTTCLKKGVLLDVFSPIRETFIS